MEYYSLNEYLKNTYGRKLYKIAIDGGFTCPNRDGTLGTKGCIFCSGKGSGDFAQSREKSITEQIDEGKELIAGKMKNACNEGPSYIAYFQAYTNTYASVNVLRKKYMEAINHPDVAIISIATRPDCLGEDVIDLLAELNRIKPIWVELGLQTIHSQTAQYIRRGYELEVYDRAVEQLARIGITQIITHVILGLPSEDKEMMLDTVRYVAGSKSNGIKLQLLHVIKGTQLEKEYLAGNIKVLSGEEYIDILKECVELLPKDMVVHRLTGDGDKRTLVAPMWSADKKRVLNAIKNA